MASAREQSYHWQSSSYIEDLRVNIWKFGISNVVSFRHLSFVGFVERIRMEHDQAKGKDIGMILQ